VTPATGHETALERLATQVREAAAARRPLVIRAGGSKDFYGNETPGERLDPRAYAGVVAYEPTELVLTARAGTPLADVERLLAGAGQMLAFEPPHFGAQATLGGCVAAGLAGPRRAATGPASGGVRESVLGARLLDGRGVVLSFGGVVIKNVAGYDVSRLLAGSLGTLGVLLEVSLRVVPKPSAERTLVLDLDGPAALLRMTALGREPLPVSATVWEAGRLAIRLSGAESAVAAAAGRLGGALLGAVEAEAFWRSVREQTRPFFAMGPRLWRVALPANRPPLGLAGEECLEWRGMLRWLVTDATAEVIRARAAALGGHATLFRGPRAGTEVFTPLAPAVARIESRLRAEFDPAGIFNPGRMHADAAR
jgi:glycolate oxidase FAD binding subunit